MKARLFSTVEEAALGSHAVLLMKKLAALPRLAGINRPLVEVLVPLRTGAESSKVRRTKSLLRILPFTIFLALVAGCQPGPKLTISPSSGPDGTEAVITVSGAESFEPVLINRPSGQIVGSADSEGKFVASDRFEGCKGDVISVTGTVGRLGQERNIGDTFTITEPPCSDDEGELEPERGEGVERDETGSGSQADEHTTDIISDESIIPPITVTLNPSSGPDGIEVVITVSGAEPGDAVAVYLPPLGEDNGSADASGKYVTRGYFQGCKGDVIAVTATVGSTGYVRSASATFTITEPPCPDDDGEKGTGDGDGGERDEITVTLNPSSGPDGIEVVITVSGAKPGEAVAVALPVSGQDDGSADASGKYVTRGFFQGCKGDVLTVTATVGSTGYERSASAIFSVTDPECPEAMAQLHSDMGFNLYNEGDLDGALSHFSEALEFDPLYAFAYYGLGLVYDSLGETQLAISDYEQFLALYLAEDEYSDYAFERIEVLSDYERAVEVGYHSDLGFSHYNQGDLEAALIDFERAIRLDPQYALAYYGLGLVYDSLGETQYAVIEYEQFLELYLVEDEYSDYAYERIGIPLKRLN